MKQYDLKKYPFVYNGGAFPVIARARIKERVELKNVKNSWVPLFVYLDIDILNRVPDGTFCDNIQPDIETYCKNLKPYQLREFVEVVANSSLVMHQALLKIDYQDAKLTPDTIFTDNKSKSVLLTNLNSYGRSYMLEYNKKLSNFKTDKKICFAMPCTGDRPYNHTTFLDKLSKTLPEAKEMYEDKNIHKLVFTNVGPIPEEYWDDDLTIKYNTASDNLWRFFKLALEYFKNNKYDKIYFCVNYIPWIEMMKMIEAKYSLNVEYYIHDKKFYYSGIEAFR